MKTSSRFILLNVLIVTVAIIATTAFLLEQMHAEAEKQVKAAQESHLRTFWELLNTKGTKFRIVDGTMLADNYVINGNFELPDRIRSLFGGTATIFMGDTRVSTNVRKEDGTRAVGTKLVGAAYDAIFKEGKPYRGEATIFGIPYYTAYDPIRNPQGEIIGVLYVGIKKSEYFAAYDNLLIRAVAAVSLFLIFFAMLAVILVRRERRYADAIQLSESNLRSQVSFLQSLLDAIPNPIFYKDSTGHYLGCNSAFSRNIGITRDGIVGKTTFDIYPMEQAHIYHDMDKALFENPGVQTNETSFAAEDGSRRDAILYKATFKNEKNGLNGIVGVIVDISERKLAEENLRESEAKFRNLSMEFKALLEAIPDAVVLYSPELRILWANRNARLMMKNEADDIIGLPCYQAWHSFTEPCMVCPVQKSLKSGKYEHAELTYSDGSIRDMHAAPVLGENGTITGVVGITRDVTEYRKAQTQLNHLQKMDAIGQLAGGIAHDFNNILTAIIGYGHLLQLKTDSDSPSRKFVDSIMFAAERAADLTGNLLAFSRKKAFHPKPHDLNEIIRKIDSLLIRLIREDVELKREIHPYPLPILADSGQLEQVVINLVTNARDAMPSGGTITIRTMPVYLENEFIEAFGFGTPGNYAAITVSDTGTGMEEKTRERIFEPFFTTKETGKGTGLGLAIVYGIVKQHTGYIYVESEPGKGTTFSVYLPLIEELEEQPATLEIPSSLAGSETVLVAEDEDDLRKLLRSLLEDNGYTVLEAVNGEEAIATYSRHKDLVQLLILDVIMPRKNAREVYDFVTRENPGMKFLFVSGHGEETIHDSGIQGENVKVLTKPASPPKFLKMVRDILDT